MMLLYSPEKPRSSRRTRNEVTTSYILPSKRYFAELRCVDLRRRGDQMITTADFIQTHKYNPRYAIFWRLSAGLLSAEEYQTEDQIGDHAICDFFKTMDKELVDLLGPAHQRFVMHCLAKVISRNEPGGGGFGLIRAGLEKRLSQWLLFESSICRDLFLAREAEYPDNALLPDLRVGSHFQQRGILQALGYRTCFSEEIVTELEALLCRAEWEIRSAAATAIKNQTMLPETIVTELVEDLDDGLGSMPVYSRTK